MLYSIYTGAATIRRRLIDKLSWTNYNIISEFVLICISVSVSFYTFSLLFFPNKHTPATTTHPHPPPSYTICLAEEYRWAFIIIETNDTPFLPLLFAFPRNPFASLARSHRPSLSLSLFLFLALAHQSVSFTNVCDCMRVHIFCAMLLLKGTVHFTNIPLCEETFVYTTSHHRFRANVYYTSLSRTYEYARSSTIHCRTHHTVYHIYVVCKCSHVYIIVYNGANMSWCQNM